MDKKVYVAWDLQSDRETTVKLTEEQAKAIEWFVGWLDSADIGFGLAEDHAEEI